MKKLKDNVFAEKFRLLSSQGSVEDINWSSSDSSEFENVSTNIDKICKISTKRKRKRKQKVPKNMSNLDIKFIEDKDEHNTKSDVSKTLKEENSRSPILCKSQYFPPYNVKSKVPSSPILCSKALDLQSKVEKSLKSPILILKTASPKLSPKIRKKLFDIAPKNKVDTHKLLTRCQSSNDSLDRRKSNEVCSKNSKSFNVTYNIIKVEENAGINAKDNEALDNNDKKKITDLPLYSNIIKNEIKQECHETEEPETNCTIQETPEVLSLDDSMAMLKTSSKELVNKVKSYFDSHFTSESPSQQTISDILTQKQNSRTSDEVEISDTITQVPSNKNSIDSIPEPPEDLKRKDKKLRYKKDGLAYRLDSLLKKQTASISLWQHERFLAANSDFVIPKGEFKTFRICKIHFKYGSYLLNAMDLNDESFLILINRNYVLHDSLKEDSILKLYEPYKIMNFQDSKLVLNVCKFECVEVNNQKFCI